MRIAFRVDSSAEIGSGHVSRCLNLAKELRRRGCDVLFICRAHPGNRIDVIEAAGFDVAALPPGDDDAADRPGSHAHWLKTSIETDAREVRDVLAAGVDWLVVDHYSLDARWERLLAGTAKHLLVIDDLADRPHACDLLVDQNLSSRSPDCYRELAPAARHLIGPRFALLADEYALLHALLPRRGDDIRRVAAFFGGSDMRRLSRRLAEAACDPGFATIEFDLVIGRGNPDEAAIAALADTAPNLRVCTEVPSLAGVFARADLAIGGGGVSMLERCCIGLPSLVVAVAENQLPGIKAAEALGAIRHLGWHEDVDSAAMRQALRASLEQGLSTLSENGRRLVDGMGSRRVASMICPAGELQVRQADAADEWRLLEWANDPVTREQAFSPARIEPDDHRRWFAARRRSPDCRIMIGELHGLPVGQVRFDRQADAWLISYSVDPDFRGQGIGRRLLRAAVERFRRSTAYDGRGFLAEVKASNPASLRLFRSEAFAETVDDQVHRFRSA